MELLVSVAEADIGRVEAGQTATFSVDAWPNRSYTATVKKVAFGSANNNAANGANNAAASTGVVTYSTELVVANDDLSLRPGMTATVDIAIVDHKDILMVPNAALRFDPEYAASIGKPQDTDKRTLVQSLSPGGGRRWRGSPPPKPGSRDMKPHVWTIENGEPSRVEVETGITDGLNTEILNDADRPRHACHRQHQTSGNRMSEETLIDLRGLTKTYGSGAAAFKALCGVDLTIRRGEFVAVMGPSGSGKSTLMNLLGCLDSPTSGSYRFKGIAVETLNKDQRSLIRRHALGFIFQGFNLLARTSALENVELPLLYRGYSRKRRHQLAREALASVGLPDKERNTPPNSPAASSSASPSPAPSSPGPTPSSRTNPPATSTPAPRARSWNCCAGSTPRAASPSSWSPTRTRSPLTRARHPRPRRPRFPMTWQTRVNL
jgi:hypothetical protein